MFSGRHAQFDRAENSRKTMKNNLSYLILMLTDRCNLSCSYCYLGRHRKSMDHGEGRDMSFDTIDKALELFAANKKNCHVQISGGEPLLAPRQLEYTVKKIRERSPFAHIALQTNATLLNNDKVDFIKAYNIDLGISLDGDPAMQNICRGNAAGTFKALERLENKKVPFNVTCVVSSANAEKLHRVVLTLAGFSMARGIGFDLLVKKGNTKTLSIDSASPMQLKSGIKKLKQALVLVNKGRKNPILIREQEQIEMHRRRKKQSSAFCHAANGQSLAVTPKGDLYPCSQTAFDPDFFMGSLTEKNGWESILPSLGAPFFSLASYTLQNSAKERCCSCGIQTCCPGECPSRLYYNSNENNSLTCLLYQTLALPAIQADKAAQAGVPGY